MNFTVNKLKCKVNESCQTLFETLDSGLEVNQDSPHSNHCQSAKGKSMSSCIVIERLNYLRTAVAAKFVFQTLVCWWNAGRRTNSLTNSDAGHIIASPHLFLWVLEQGGQRGEKGGWGCSGFSWMHIVQGRIQAEQVPPPFPEWTRLLVTKYAERHRWLVSIIAPAS